MTFLLGDTIVGERCAIGPNARVSDSRIGDGCVVSDAVLTDETLADGASAIPCQ